MFNRIWDALIRFRTWFFNIVLALLFIVPELLNSPEILAVIPAEYQRWALVAVFLINILMRPRPATRAADPEVQVKNAISHSEGPAIVKVTADGETKALISA